MSGVWPQEAERPRSGLPYLYPRVVLREEFDDRSVLYDPQSGEACGIDRIGTLVCRSLNGRQSVKDVADILHQACRDVPDEVEFHVRDFIDALVAKGMAAYSADVEVKTGETGSASFPQSGLGTEVMRTPRAVDLAVTHRCNLRCAYCSHFSSPGDVDQDLSLKHWQAFFAELNACTVMNVTLQGGEPFCRKDLKALIQGIVDNRMRYSILSNGTLISDDSAAFLASTGRCDGVQVSIDGPSAAAHDTLRGGGSFDGAVRGIKCLQNNGVPVSVRVTIHRLNFDKLPAIARFLLEDLQLPEFSTNAASYLGLCRQNAPAVQITTAERTRAMADLLELCEAYPGRISASAGPLADGRNWQAMEEARRKGRQTLPGGGYLTGCGCPWQSIAVRADGMMVPCIQLSQIELGRIGKDSLVHVWQNHPQLKQLRARGRIALNSLTFCAGCAYVGVCTGNCPALAYSLTGDTNQPSPDACLKRFIEEGGRLPNPAL